MCQSVSWASKSCILPPNYDDLYTGSKSIYIITVYTHTFLPSCKTRLSAYCLFWNSRFAKGLSLTCPSLETARHAKVFCKSATINPRLINPLLSCTHTDTVKYSSNLMAGPLLTASSSTAFKKWKCYYFFPLAM